MNATTAVRPKPGAKAEIGRAVESTLAKTVAKKTRRPAKLPKYGAPLVLLEAVRDDIYTLQNLGTTRGRIANPHTLRTLVGALCDRLDMATEEMSDRANYTSAPACQLRAHTTALRIFVCDAVGCWLCEIDSQEEIEEGQPAHCVQLVIHSLVAGIIRAFNALQDRLRSQDYIEIEDWK